MANAEQIDKKLLAGLKFRSSEKAEGGGFSPTKRALTQDDVLDWKDTGAAVVIVTADGQKHTVDKKTKPEAGTGKE